MVYFSPTAPTHSNTLCSRPSTLRPPVSYSSQIHFHCHREMCKGVAFWRRDLRDCRVLFLSCLRIATHGMIFLDFRRLRISQKMNKLVSNSIHLNCLSGSMTHRMWAQNVRQHEKCLLSHFVSNIGIHILAKKITRHLTKPSEWKFPNNKILN